MNKRGFTMAEVLIVITILLLLAGLTVPVFRTAIDGAKQTRCKGNLRQQSLALSLYREHHGGSDTPGPIAQMGIPDWATPAQYVSVLGGSEATYNDIQRCPVRQHAGYKRYWPNHPDSNIYSTPEQYDYELKNWTAYLTDLGSKAPVLVDTNHNAVQPETLLSTKRVHGVTLEGALIIKSARGNPGLRDWWR